MKTTLNLLLSSFLVLLLVLFIGTPFAKTPGVLIAADPNGTQKVILYDAPCGGKVKAMFGGIAPLGARQGLSVMGQDTKELCWRLQGNYVYVLDEDGQQGQISMELFKPAEDI